MGIFVIFWIYGENRENEEFPVFPKTPKNTNFHISPLRCEMQKMGYFGERVKMTKKWGLWENGKNGVFWGIPQKWPFLGDTWKRSNLGYFGGRWKSEILGDRGGALTPHTLYDLKYQLNPTGVSVYLFPHIFWHYIFIRFVSHWISVNFI